MNVANNGTKGAAAKTDLDARPDQVEQKIDALTRLVGARVRHARQSAGLSRRELSEISGVSQRYLAQVEAGQGNISIALLLKVGDALDQHVEWFVGGDDPAAAQERHLTHLFRRAGIDQRNAALDILGGQPTDQKQGRRIALIGLRGAGKSTLGRRLAHHLETPFAELNTEIEDQSAMSVADVMALYGQDGYRAMEQRALRRVISTHDAAVLAVAGGIVSAPDTFTLLLQSCHTVWLRAAPDDHMNRVRAQGDHRPMAGNPDALDELKAILVSREAQYGRADVTLDTAKRTEDESLQDLIEVAATLGIERQV